VRWLGLSTLLTIVSLLIARTTLAWPPGIPVALAVLASAQLGVHVAYFLPITTASDNVINAMAVSVLMVELLITGSLRIVTHANHSMMPMEQVMLR
jgi:cytochrome o ubiquinol oxidase subunit IV